MIKFGPYEVMWVITLITTIIYMLEDGKSLLRYLTMIGLYVFAIFAVLPNDVQEIYVLVSFGFLYFILRKLLRFVLPKYYLRTLVSNEGFRVINYRKSIVEWESIRATNLKYIIYTLVLLLGLVVSINYF